MKPRRPQPLCRLGDRCPELGRLRDRLYAQVVDFDDLPEAWGRLVLNLPDKTPAWSRNDAILRG